MEDGFYQDHMALKGIRTIVPGPEDRTLLHRAIYDELCQGVFKDSTRSELRRIIQRLARDGATGVVLGCTELGLLIRQEDLTLPLFDTTQLHAAEAVKFALT
jgi:aspartate racemase